MIVECCWQCAWNRRSSIGQTQKLFLASGPQNFCHNWRSVITGQGIGDNEFILVSVQSFHELHIYLEANVLFVFQRQETLPAVVKDMPGIFQVQIVWVLLWFQYLRVHM